MNQCMHVQVYKYLLSVGEGNTFCNKIVNSTRHFTCSNIHVHVHVYSNGRSTCRLSVILRLLMNTVPDIKSSGFKFFYDDIVIMIIKTMHLLFYNR